MRISRKDDFMKFNMYKNIKFLGVYGCWYRKLALIIEIAWSVHCCSVLSSSRQTPSKLVEGGRSEESRADVWRKDNKFVRRNCCVRSLTDITPLFQLWTFMSPSETAHNITTLSVSRELLPGWSDWGLCCSVQTIVFKYQTPTPDR